MDEIEIAAQNGHISEGSSVSLNYGQTFSFDAALLRSGASVGGEFDGETIAYTVRGAGISAEETIAGGTISASLGALPVGSHTVQVKYPNDHITVTFPIMMQPLPVTITAGSVPGGAVEIRDCNGTTHAVLTDSLLP